jgi:hypothetical protein
MSEHPPLEGRKEKSRAFDASHGRSPRPNRRDYLELCQILRMQPKCGGIFVRVHILFRLG